MRNSDSLPLPLPKSASMIREREREGKWERQTPSGVFEWSQR